MFKVYIVGDTIKVVRRKSLTNVDENDLCKKGVSRFPRVSCAAASADEANLEPGVAGWLPLNSFLFFCYLNSTNNAVNFVIFELIFYVLI